MKGGRDPLSSRDLAPATRGTSAIASHTDRGARPLMVGDSLRSKRLWVDGGCASVHWWWGLV